MSKLMTWAQILFFGLYGLSHFFGISWASLVIAVAALVIGFVLLIGELR